MRRKQFTFYESFFEAIQCIGGKAQRADAYDALCAYALRGELPDFKRLSAGARMVMTVCMPVLTAAHKKAEAGQKGGILKMQRKMPMGASGVLGEEEQAAIQRMLAE